MLKGIWPCGQRAEPYLTWTLFSRSVIFFAALTVLTPVAEACRYSVRDVGFADLGNERYTLRCFVDDPENGGSADPLGQAAKPSQVGTAGDSKIACFLPLLRDAKSHSRFVQNLRRLCVGRAVEILERIHLKRNQQSTWRVRKTLGRGLLGPTYRQRTEFYK